MSRLARGRKRLMGALAGPQRKGESK
jgi:hypothetical protein